MKKWEISKSKSPDTAKKQKKVEEKLRDDLFFALAEQSSDIILLVNNKGVITYENPAVSILGLNAKERVGSNAFEHVHPDDLKLINDSFHVLFSNTNAPVQRAEVRLSHKDGTWHVFEATGNNLLHNNVVEAAIVNLRDITERKKAEEFLKQSEEKYRLLAGHMTDTVWITDLNLKVSYISPSAERLLGYTLEEIIPIPLDKLLTAVSFKEAMDFFAIELPKALAASPDYVPNRLQELEFVCKNGQTVWGECMFSLIRDDKGNPLSILGEAREITKRKQIEDSLRISEENFRHSLDDSPLGVRISSVEGETIYANKAILDIYGYNGIEELKTTPIKERYTPESYAEWQERKKKRLYGNLGPSEYEISIVRKTGEVRHLYVFRKEIFWNGKKQSQVIYNDITLRRRAQEKIHQSEEKYRTILENIEDGYYEVDLAGNFTFFNDSMCRILGYDKEEMMGLNNQQYTDKDNSKKLFQAFNKVYKTGETTRGFDWQITRKDGTKRYIEASVSLRKDSLGKFTGFRGLVHDITDRKKAEEKLKQTLESLKRAVGTTIQVLVSALESKDPYTAGHQSRVADLARAIATEMGLAENIIEGIRLAGVIHDIGKLSIPAEILTKPTKLTNLEFSLIKEHAQIGYEMLKDVESPWPLADIVHQHHERINGSGYPRKLKEDEILFEARILAVADVVEAMASHRPYRASLGIEPALEEIEKNKGVLYDKNVADTCLRLFREKGYQFT